MDLTFTKDELEQYKYMRGKADDYFHMFSWEDSVTIPNDKLDFYFRLCGEAEEYLNILIRRKRAAEYVKFKDEHKEAIE